MAAEQKKIAWGKIIGWGGGAIVLLLLLFNFKRIKGWLFPPPPVNKDKPLSQPPPITTGGGGGTGSSATVQLAKIRELNGVLASKLGQSGATVKAMGLSSVGGGKWSENAYSQLLNNLSDSKDTTGNWSGNEQNSYLLIEDIFGAGTIDNSNMSAYIASLESLIKEF